LNINGKVSLSIKIDKGSTVLPFEKRTLKNNKIQFCLFHYYSIIMQNVYDYI